MNLVPVVQQRKLPFPRGVCAVVPIAWPTIFLGVATIVLSASTHYLFFLHHVSYFVCLFFWTLSAYLSFTVMHDASHGSLATNQSGWVSVNEMFGHMCAIPLGVPFLAFKHLHLKHHKYTNVAGADPDLWSSSATRYKYLTIFRWSTQLWAYLLHYRRKRCKL